MSNQADAINSLHKSMGIGVRGTPKSRVTQRREVAAAQVEALESVLADIRRKARETPAWAAAYNSAATSVELKIAHIKSNY